MVDRIIMKLRYRNALAVFMVAHCVVAAAFETEVRDTCAGDVRIVCKNADGWRFDVGKVSSGGVDEISIRLSSGREAAPPRFEVSFSFPQVRMNHLWTDFATDGRRLRPDWSRWHWSDIAHGALRTARRQ